MIDEGTRDFAARDWEAARDAKDTHWSVRIARLGVWSALAPWMNCGDT